MLVLRVLAILGFAALTFELGSRGIDLIPGVVFCYGLAVVGIVIYYRFSAYERMIKSAPMRQIPISLRLGPDGVSAENALVQYHHRWGAFIGTIEDTEYLLLLQSAREFIPLPLDQLPEGWDAARLATQIEDWRGQ